MPGKSPLIFLFISNPATILVSPQNLFYLVQLAWAFDEKLSPISEKELFSNIKTTKHQVAWVAVAERGTFQPTMTH